MELVPLVLLKGGGGGGVSQKPRMAILSLPISFLGEASVGRENPGPGQEAGVGESKIGSGETTMLGIYQRLAAV